MREYPLESINWRWGRTAWRLDEETRFVVAYAYANQTHSRWIPDQS